MGGQELRLRQAMWAHLWTKTIGPPSVYVKAILCRDVFHCRPSQLREENAVEVYQILNALGVEGSVLERKLPPDARI